MRNLLLAVALCSLWAGGQFRVSTELVLVDVVVRDAQGAFVPGLTAADFQLADQGKAQKITSFEVYRGERPAEGAQGGAAAHWMIILVDGVNTTFEATGLAADSIKKWLGAAPSGTPVMVASLTRSSVRVLVPFTADHAQALDTMRKAPVVTALSLGLDEVQREVDRARDLDQVVQAASNFARVVEEQVRDSNIAFRRFLATLGGYPGRKNLVYLTAGYPLRPSQTLMQRIRESTPAGGSEASLVSMKLGQIPQVDVTDSLKELAATANAFGVSFYPIDSRGLVVAASRIEQDRLQESQDTLFLLASVTGGQVTYNTNALDRGMQRAAQELGEYYLLGFRPEADKKPRFHELDVKVVKPGLQVRGRRGYFSGTTDEQRVNAALAAALSAPEFATAIPFADRIAVDGQKVTVDVAIPVDAVRVLHQGSGVRIQLQLLGMVSKPDGSRVGKDYQISRPFNLELTAEQYKQLLAQQSLVTRNEFNLAPGGYQLTLALRDLASGAIGARREKLEVR
jgi:VWFA-related protein